LKIIEARSSEIGPVVVTPREFSNLKEYSCSYPTGVIVGKRWKRKKNYYDESKGWWLGEYIYDPEPGWATVRWREIQIMEA
jgi:hypothetical protein